MLRYTNRRGFMTQSGLFSKITKNKINISNKVIKCAIKEILEYMITSLAEGKKIEIRGFGSFTLHYRASRIGRNPKTGSIVTLNPKYVTYFKPGKQLRNRANIYT